MLLVGDSSNKSLSQDLGAILGATVIYPEITVFPDSEKRVRINHDVAGQKVILVKAVYPPVDACVIELAFLVDALVKNGADKIIGAIPDLPYMRADHLFRSGEAVPLEVVINMIENTGLHEVIIVDPHSIKIPEMFKIKVHNFSAFTVFAEKIKELESDKNKITIISPDMGGIRRLKILDVALGGVNQMTVNKDRDYESGEVKVAATEGKIQGSCFIVDDIISTGKTIVQAVEKLTGMGAEKVYVLATHAVFSEGAIDLLTNSSAEKIYITDSIPMRDGNLPQKIEVLPLAKLISQAIS